MRFSRAALFAVLAGCAAPAPPPPEPCVPPTAFTATGFFRVDDSCGDPVLVDPRGARFVSTGVNDVRFNGDYTPAGKNPYLDAVTAKYGGKVAWAAEAKKRLGEWGFNTIGSWSDVDLFKDDLAFTLTLDLAGSDWRTGKTPDYFSDGWAVLVDTRAEAGIAGHTTDHNLLGWFMDNELHWGPDWRLDTELFEEYLAIGRGNPGRTALQHLLRDRHGGDIADFNAAWDTGFASFDALEAASTLPHPDRMGAAMRADREAFLRLLADRYFSVTTAAIRKRDPNHLILGTRAVGVLVPKVVLESAGQFIDVVSINAYEYDVDPALVWPPAKYGFLPIEKDGFLRAHHEASGKPILVSEFGFRAADSGLPNSWPPVYPVLKTQAERTERFAAYVQRCKDAPWVVGYHWYKFQDQPPEGRFDGENNNWGLVDLTDAPWAALTARAAEANRAFVGR